MPCTRPLKAYKGKYNKKTGKFSIVFKKQEANKNIGYTDREGFQLPCGKCIECRLEKSRQWAVRMVNEAQCHRENMFLTLTYSDDYIPKNYSINKREIQLFIKRLRKKADKKIKYFAIGEYGDRFKRPHYHACIFGYDFMDKEPLNTLTSANKRKYQYWISEELKKLWKKGNHLIGKLNFETAMYVAKYVTKVKTGERPFNYEGKLYKNAEEYYAGLTPEFALMSKKTPIGKEWFDKYKEDLYRANGMVIKKDLTVKIPIYYNNLIKEIDPEKYEELKKERRLKLEELDYFERCYLDSVRKTEQKQLKRSKEDGYARAEIRDYAKRIEQ